jgi:hypothetical protein
MVELPSLPNRRARPRRNRIRMDMEPPRKGSTPPTPLTPAG